VSPGLETVFSPRGRARYRAAGTTAAIIHRRMIAGLRDICSNATPFLIFLTKGTKAPLSGLSLPTIQEEAMTVNLKLKRS
jgi:hypothetical protein